jgi:hypothetical protein
MNNTNIKTVANEFGMPVEKFVELYREKRLPGQLPSRTFYEQQDSEIDLGVNLDAIKRSPAWQRIKRAAGFNGESVRGFVTEAIMETVRGCEEVMVLSPRTGKPICRNWDIDDWTGETIQL